MHNTGRLKPYKLCTLRYFMYIRGIYRLSVCFEKQWNATFNDGGSLSVKIQSVNSTTKHTFFFSKSDASSSTSCKACHLCFDCHKHALPRTEVQSDCLLLPILLWSEKLWQTAWGDQAKKRAQLEKTSLTKFCHSSPTERAWHQVFSSYHSTKYYHRPSLYGQAVDSCYHQKTAKHTLCFFFCRSSKQR